MVESSAADAVPAVCLVFISDFALRVMYSWGITNNLIPISKKLKNQKIETETCHKELVQGEEYSPSFQQKSYFSIIESVFDAILKFETFYAKLKILLISMDQTTNFEVIIVYFTVIFSFFLAKYSNFMHDEKKWNVLTKIFLFNGILKVKYFLTET